LKKHFGAGLSGFQLLSFEKAASIFDFAVNARVKTSIVLAQKVVGAKEDGIIGKETIAKINACPDEEFTEKYIMAKIARYVYLIKKNRKLEKFLFGWIRRSLNDF
jgi:lysozyme family protein